MNKNIVVLGGGTGQSVLIKGLKEFPINLTSVVSVADDGRSTGKLRDEFDLPAMGDIRKVITSMAKTEPLVEKLLEYRFDKDSSLNGHTVGNILLTASANITGNMSDGIEALTKVLNLRGKVLPLTEDNVTLVANMADGTVIEGEHNITNKKSRIESIYYKRTPEVNKEVLKAIKKADLIILSMGSMFTSILPCLICPEIIKEIDKSNAKIMYICNLMTQPGETDNLTVSDHINVINKYLGKKKIDIVLANNKNISDKVIDKYKVEEQKEQVLIDFDNLNDVKVIASNFYKIDNNKIVHDSLQLSLSIFSYLVREKMKERI